jgi:hypothetical protein
MEPTTPPQPPSDHPVWGPPRDPLISSGPPIPPAPARRAHPAHRARRFAGLATLASSAAIVGYMATAGAMSPTGQAVVTATTVAPTTNEPAVVAAPAIPTPHPQTQTRARQAPATRPVTSSHGS